MKAIVQDTYGGSDALLLRDVADPVPKDADVLVAVRAAALHIRLPAHEHQVTNV